MRVNNDTGASNYPPHRKDSNPFLSSSMCFIPVVKKIVITEYIASLERRCVRTAPLTLSQRSV
jgi:hypothetical protein